MLKQYLPTFKACNPLKQSKIYFCDQSARVIASVNTGCEQFHEFIFILVLLYLFALFKWG